MGINFIHTADLHLGRGLDFYPESSLTIYSDLLKEIAETARQNNVDFILFSGDTFNNHDVEVSIKKLFLDFIKELNADNIDIYYACGNHDYYIPAFYRPFKREKNFYIFPENWHTFYKKDLAIHGFSFYEQALKKRMLSVFPTENLSKANLFCFHTNIEELGSIHENYAPSSFDEYEKISAASYFSLGHIHKKSEWIKAKNNLVYPGSPLPTRHNETGEKGFYLVKLCSNQRFEKIFSPSVATLVESYIDISESEDILEVNSLIEETVSKTETEIKNRYIAHNIKLTGCVTPSVKKEILEHIADGYLYEAGRIANIEDKSLSEISPEQIAENKGLFETITEIFKTMEFEDVPLDSKVLNEYSETDIKDFNSIKRDALSVLYSMLKDDR
jgi:DNA repair exonuclease SbcCD nuclease subunit